MVLDDVWSGPVLLFVVREYVFRVFVMLKLLQLSVLRVC
jgi:hypothetical protein